MAATDLASERTGTAEAPDTKIGVRPPFRRRGDLQGPAVASGPMSNRMAAAIAKPDRNQRPIAERSITQASATWSGSSAKREEIPR
jgi:hypothetical protein